MEPLAELLVGREPDLDIDQYASVYVLENGNRIVASQLSTPETDLLDIRSVFRSASTVDNKQS
jgi:hypothetical protein